MTPLPPDRIIERNRGPAEISRLSRGLQYVTDLLGPSNAATFWDTLAHRAGLAAETVIWQMLDYAEKNLNSDILKTHKEAPFLFLNWRDELTFIELYGMACVEAVRHDKTFAAQTSQEREETAMREELIKKINEGVQESFKDKIIDHGKELAALSAMMVISGSAAQQLLPESTLHHLTEMAQAGTELIVHATELASQGPLAIGLTFSLGVGATLALSYVKARWKQWRQHEERRSEATLPESLYWLQVNRSWEPLILSEPRFQSLLALEPLPAVSDPNSLAAFSRNRHRIVTHCDAAFSSIKTLWLSLDDEHRQAFKDWPASTIIHAAALALDRMDATVQKNGFGSHDISRLEASARSRLVTQAFEEIAQSLSRSNFLPPTDRSPEPLAQTILDKLLARRQPSPAVAASSPAASAR